MLIDYACVSTDDQETSAQVAAHNSDYRGVFKVAIHNGFREIRPAEFRPGEVRPVKVHHDKVRIVEVCVSQVWKNISMLLPPLIPRPRPLSQL